MKKQTDGDPRGLFAKVRSQNKEQLAGAIEEVEELEPEQQESRSRALDHGLEKHWKSRIRPKLNWFLLIVIILIVVFFMTLGAILVGTYFSFVISTESKVNDLVHAIFNAGLISGTTLFLNGLYRGRR